MQELIAGSYPWIKALHVFSVILWMSAQLTLPLLLAAHRSLAADSAPAQLLAVLERRLIRRLLNPAILAAFLFGGLMVYAVAMSPGGLPHWLQLKLVLVLLLSGLHGFLVREGKRMAAGRARWSEAAWRRLQRLDLVLLAHVVGLVILKPAF